MVDLNQIFEKVMTSNDETPFKCISAIENQTATDALKSIKAEKLFMVRMDSIESENEEPLKDFPVKMVSQCELPICLNGKDLGTWSLKCFLSTIDGLDHVALICGDIYDSIGGPVLTRVHSECLTGDVLGSLRCDCRAQLELSLEKIASVGRGVFIYNRGHEGRGIGLGNKIRAYALQQTLGLDTYTANRHLGFDDDLRTYTTAKSILQLLGVKKIRLLSENKMKRAAFSELMDSYEPVECTPNLHNQDYLLIKKSVHGH